MRKQMDMKNLLQWAFVHELTKGGGMSGLGGLESSWSKIMGVHVLGTIVQTDRSGSGGSWIEQGEAHRDAKLIGEAVRDLAGTMPEFTADWDCFADVPELAEHLADIPARVAVRFLNMPARSRDALPVTLVMSAATLGRGPDWTWPEGASASMVEVNGRAAWFATEERRFPGQRKPVMVEVDGLDPVSRRPKRGAYRKWTVSPDPLGVALARADWQIWVGCLHLLTESLAGALADWEPVLPDLRMSPWVPEAPVPASAAALNPLLELA